MIASYRQSHMTAGFFDVTCLLGDSCGRAERFSSSRVLLTLNRFDVPFRRSTVLNESKTSTCGRSPVSFLSHRSTSLTQRQQLRNEMHSSNGFTSCLNQNLNHSFDGRSSEPTTRTCSRNPLSVFHSTTCSRSLLLPSNACPTSAGSDGAKNNAARFDYPGVVEQQTWLVTTLGAR